MHCLSSSNEVSLVTGTCSPCSSNRKALTLLVVSVLLALGAYLCHYYKVGHFTMPTLTAASALCFVGAGVMKIDAWETKPIPAHSLPKPIAASSRPQVAASPPSASQQILALYHAHSTLTVFKKALGREWAQLTSVEKDALFEKIIHEKKTAKHSFGATVLRAILPTIAAHTLRQDARSKFAAAAECNPEAAQVLLEDGRFPICFGTVRSFALIACVQHNRLSLLSILLLRHEVQSNPPLIQGKYTYKPPNGSLPVSFNALEWAYCFQKREQGSKKKEWDFLIQTLKLAGIEDDPKPTLLGDLYTKDPMNFLKNAGDFSQFTHVQETHFLCEGLHPKNQEAFNQLLQNLTPFLSEEALNARVTTKDETQFLLQHFIRHNPRGAEILIAHPRMRLVFEGNLTVLHHAAHLGNIPLVRAILRRDDASALINNIADFAGKGLCTALDLATGQCAELIAQAQGKKASSLQAKTG